MFFYLSILVQQILFVVHLRAAIQRPIQNVYTYNQSYFSQRLSEKVVFLQIHCIVVHL